MCWSDRKFNDFTEIIAIINKNYRNYESKLKVIIRSLRNYKAILSDGEENRQVGTIDSYAAKLNEDHLKKWINNISSTYNEWEVTFPGRYSS